MINEKNIKYKLNYNNNSVIITIVLSMVSLTLFNKRLLALNVIHIQ